MAADNVALTHRLYDDLRTGGFDAVRQYWTDDVVLVEASEFPDASTYRGKDAVAARFKDRMDLGFRYGLDIDRAGALTDDTVFAALKVHRSDMDLSFGYWQIVAWRDGLVVEIREYLDVGRADQAAAELRRAVREP